MVSVGGFATCPGVAYRGSVPAKSVTIRLDTGAQVTVGTSSLPWKFGRFDMSFSWIPSQGTGYTGTVTCPLGTPSKGGSWRGFLKPDWRNTTGTITYKAP